MPAPAPAPPVPRSDGPPAWTVLPHPPGGRGEPAARRWLGERLGLAPDTLPLARDGRGRPCLGPPLSAWDCSWSHSGDRLLVALGSGIALGADLERLRPRPRALELARRWFAPAEAEWLAAAPADARERAFLRLWCAKEAVLKAHGHGLAFGLHRLAFMPAGTGLVLAACDDRLGRPEDWTLRLLDPSPDTVAALAWRAAPADGPGHTVAA